ncbi:YopX family protein [Lactococcus raffinolactis]|uniref:YopX family protein n=1 Tax=Pseudolactococcus raffinolactis TaxID=1366 RepID=UPI001436C1E8|nr:YopX family protein [Lactococcus raffinolactis]QIW50769.1 hypothetical protein GU337_02175 [Lactococcus raffinolactis]
MIPKFKAFLKETKQIVDVETIHFELGVVKVNGIELYQFEDIILMQSTGIYDKHGVEIFEGYIIQQVHAYDYDKLEIETDYLEPFEVKKGNYTQGKWVAEEIDEKHYSVVRYVFGKDVKVIGNVHENPELLGE